MATSATDATLLLIPDPDVDLADLANHPFPVAWYREGIVTFQRGGEVVCEIEIGEADFLRATSVPGVVLASTFEPGEGYARYAVVNIATGEMLDLGSGLQPCALWRYRTSPSVRKSVDSRLRCPIPASAVG